MMNMDDVNALMPQARAAAFTMFGGPEKMDVWLTELADVMTRVEPMSDNKYRNLMSPEMWARLGDPMTVVDSIIETFEKLRAWSYQIKIVDGKAIVLDTLYGHEIEEAPEPNLQSLATKYGPCVEVV